MIISQSDWSGYRDKQKSIREKAASLMQAWIDKNGLADRYAMTQYAAALIDKYGEAAGALACDMYDELAVAQGVTLPAAVPAPLYGFGEVAKAINGSLLQSETGLKVPQVVERMTKQAGADTMLKNAKRDRAEWAWVPSGDTCAFCITLASRGWQHASKAAMKGGHAEHIHANCDCEYVIRFDGKSSVKGYDPDKYLEMYYGAYIGEYENENMARTKKRQDGFSNAQINALRRELYANKKASIMNRARTIKNEAVLREITKSDIIDMEKYDDIVRFFDQKKIQIIGFENKDILDVKAVFAGVDDALNLMPGAEAHINKIVYNPKLKVMGKMHSDGLMEIGPSGLRDYGTGAHETAHAFDFAMSNGNSDFSEQIVESARKALNLRKNSKEYLNLRIRLCGNLQDADKPYEVFAYGVETELGGVDNKLAKAIVDELRNIK